MTVIQDITQDLTIPIRQVIYSKTGDSERYVRDTIFNDSAVWNIPAGTTGVVYATDEKGVHSSNNNVTFENNVILAQLPVINNRGIASAEIELTCNGVAVATFDFVIMVGQSA